MIIKEITAVKNHFFLVFFKNSNTKLISTYWLKNDEKINVQILTKRFFDIQVKKRRLSGAKTSIFNEVDRKISKVKMNSYF